MAYQSNDELIRVADEFFRSFCPSDLVKDGPNGTKNAELIMGHCLQRHGFVSISGMTESASELAADGYLALIPAPKVKTQEELAQEFQAKELKRIQREQLENSVPFQDRMAAAEKDKKDAEKEKARQVSAWKERDRLIDNYSINLGPGRTDHARSEYFKEQLRGIKATRSNGTMDWVVVLKTVQEALSKLP
jgi:hypothetical protein